tara:strand:+ start:41 stop:163 length:123 start_codon:yes stop_codon:yes gene_type:complete
MKILNFIKEKVKRKKLKTKTKSIELIEKENWLEGEGPQTD